MRILLLNSQVAPFQIELAQAANAIPGIRFTIGFTHPSTRASHWELSESASCCRMAPEGTAAAGLSGWLEQLIADEQPSVILVTGIRGAIYDAAARHDQSAHVGLWLEQPMAPRPWLYRRVRDLEYRLRLRKVDFVLAIGDRALSYYRRLSPRVALVPYGQDLSTCLNAPGPAPSGKKLRFAFSGQLVARHNIGLITAAVERVFDRVGPRFELVVAAYGPDDRFIRELLERRPELREVIKYDRDFATWDDRHRPLLSSDVLLYPSSHSGWGLVVPEAMAAGLLVIATPFVEAARFFITDGEDGVLIPPTLAALETQMLKCVAEPDWVRRLGERARIAARRGDAPAVANRLIEAVAALGGGARS
jgi:glycosyltransferase involved in cell wall biosynthesis